MKNFNIGDVVIIDKKKVINFNLKFSKEIHLPPWYTNQIYTIIEKDSKNNECVFLNKNLPNSDNRINIAYLKLLKKERKKKLLKLASL